MVIAVRSSDWLRAQYDWNGEAVQAFGAKTFWRMLNVEREQIGTDVRCSEVARVERVVVNRKRPA